MTDNNALDTNAGAAITIATPVIALVATGAPPLAIGAAVVIVAVGGALALWAWAENQKPDPGSDRERGG